MDSEWRDRAGLNGGEFGSRRTRESKARAAADSQYHAEPSYMKHRTAGHTETSISGDTRADWSDAFELVPSLQIAYVWHASRFTREVLDGLLRIGLVHHQQIIWDKERTVLTRTLYWLQQRAVLVRTEEERAVVRQGRRELDDLGGAAPEVRYGRERRDEI